MRKKSFKVVALLACTGTVFQLGGCLGTIVQASIQGIPGTVLTEFLLDNDGFFDLFEDGATADAAG